MSTRLQHNMDKKAPAQRLSSLSPVALLVMGLVGAADALAAVREALVQNANSSPDHGLTAKTTVMDYNAVASLVQALVREGMAPEEAALQVQVALQAANPLMALSALVQSVTVAAETDSAQDVSLSALVDALTEQISQADTQGQVFDLLSLQELVPQSAGFAPADLAQALDVYNALEQGAGVAPRGGNAEVAQNQIDLLLAQASQTGAAVATDAGAASTAAASSGAAAAGALSAAQAVALVGLAAVAGGAFSSSAAGGAAGIGSLLGFVTKGPVSGSTVYLDVNGNLVQDGNEYLTVTTTEEDGSYTIPNLSQFTLTANSKIIASGGTDTFTGNTLGTLMAPTSAKMVTPLTTLLAANPQLTAADLKTVLGLSYDPLTYNPFAAGVSAADKLAAEGLALQLNTLLNTLSTALVGSGVTASSAFSVVASSLAQSLVALKGTASVGGATLFSDAASPLLTSVVSSLQTNYASASSALASAKTSVAEINSQIKETFANATSLDQVKSDLGTALGVPVANASLLPDVSVLEDVAISGTGGSSLTTLPKMFTATNISRDNLLKFFDNDSSTVGQVPTLTFDMAGYTVTDNPVGVSSLDLVVSLVKNAFAGRDLTLTLNDVKLDAATTSGNTTFTLPSQTISATVKMGSVTLGTYSFSNVDADLLTLNSGSNTVGASPSFSLKLDSLFAKMTNGTGDVLDLTTLSNKALIALGGALVVGVVDDLTPANIVAKLKSLITLPASVDSVSELVSLAQKVVDFPEVSSLKIIDLLSLIPDGGTKTLLIAAAGRANVDVSQGSVDTISTALSKFGVAFGTYQLSELSTLLSNGLGLDQGVSLLDMAKDLVVAALNKAQGLTAEQILDKAIGALIEANNGDLRALLAGVDLQSIVGSHVDVLNVLNNIVQHGTVKYVDLINLGAHTLLSTDSALVVKATDFQNLSVTADGAAQTSLQISVPIGTATSFTPPAGTAAGLSIAKGAFTDPNGDTLTYTATLSDGSALPTWLKFDPVTKSFSGTPTNDQVGELNIKVSVKDPAGNTVSDLFKLTVTDVNDAPQLVANATTTATAVELATASFDVSKAFKDVDSGDVLAYSVASGTTLPSGWTLNAGVLAGIAPLNSTSSNETQTIKITATDKSGASVTQDFTLTVANDNTPPANLTPTLVEDNGTNTTDWITGNGRISINAAALESGAKWFSSVKGVVTEQTGKTYFDLPVGSYAADDVKVYQQDQAGNNSAVQASLGKALTVVTAPGAPTITITDSANTSDGITNVKSVSVALTDGATSWAYSLKSAAYVTGSGSSFDLLNGTTYAVGDIKVKQYNAAGIGGSSEATNTTPLTVDQTAPGFTSLEVGSVDANGVYTINFTLSESVTGFTASDVSVSGGAVGAMSGQGASYSLLVTPDSSNAAIKMTVNVAAGAAVDPAGNSSNAATELAKWVLYGTSGGDTLTGSANADMIRAQSGDDVISAGAGADTIWAGAGNDSITGGAGADSIHLGDGLDKLIYVSASDSSSAASDTIEGFQTGDKIDLSQVLDYTSLSQYSFTSSSPLQLTNWRADPDQVEHPGGFLVDLVAKEALFTTATSIKSMVINVDFAASGVSAFYGASFNSKFSLNTVGDDPGVADTFGSIVMAKESSTSFSGALASGAVLATVGFTPTNASGFTFYAKDIGFAVGSDTSSPALPLPIGATGVTTGALSGVLSPIFETTETTVGDNQLHVIYDKVTGKVDIKFDQNPGAGTTSVVAGDTIHIEGITGLDFTKNDFTFV